MRRGDRLAVVAELAARLAHRHHVQRRVGESLRGDEVAGATVDSDGGPKLRHPPLRQARRGAPQQQRLVRLGGGVNEDRAALSEEARQRSEEHTSELQSLMRISYAVFCLKKTHYINNIRDYT